MSPEGNTLRSLLRRVYGVRLRILHQRSALMNGLAIMWSDETTPLDGDVFCWTGSTEARRTGDGSGPDGEKTAQDHIVNVLAAQINGDGKFILENVMKRYEEWTRPPEQPSTSDTEEPTDGSA